MYLAIYHISGKILSKGEYPSDKIIPSAPEGQSLLIIENPNTELLSFEIELVDDGQGGYTAQVKQDTRPFCQLLLKKDDGSGNLVSAWDEGYQAYLYQTNENIIIEGNLCADEALTIPIPGTIAFRTPVLRNGLQDKVYFLSFVDGVVQTKTVTIPESGIYKITDKEANKVRLLDENKNQITQIKFIVAE